MSSATNFGVTLTSDRLNPRNFLLLFFMVITSHPRFHKSILPNETLCNVGMATVIFHKCLHCNWTSVLRHMVIGRPNYSKSSCCNIILHCNTSTTTSASANLTRCVKRHFVLLRSNLNTKDHLNNY